MLGLLADTTAWEFGWTAVAGLATASLAALTWWLAKSTRDLARETDQDIRASWRPIVVLAEPQACNMEIRRNLNDAGVGYCEIKIDLDLTNVGQGPAMNTQIEVASTDTDKPAVYSERIVNTIPVEKGVHTTVNGTSGVPDGHDWTSINLETARVIYQDIAENIYETELRLFVDGLEREFDDEGQLRLVAKLDSTVVGAMTVVRRGRWGRKLAAPRFARD